MSAHYYLKLHANTAVFTANHIIYIPYDMKL